MATSEKHFLIVVLAALTLLSGISTRDEAENREKKLLSIFQVVRFNNDVCAASSNRNGTCYTPFECENRNGANGGSCAGGFGVCCVFSESCGDSSSENNTYFTIPATGVLTTGDCTLTLRLDFEQFSITGPSTLTDTVLTTLGGQPNTLDVKTTGNVRINGAPVSSSSQCLTDTFTVTNPGGPSSPTLCGLLTNDHMYIDAAEACNDLTFTLGSLGVGTTLRPRTWNIKVTQFSCDFENLAPRGCTQYFFNQGGAGTLRSFNYEGGMHLANQQQSICIRRERTFCRVCFYAAARIDVVISGINAKARTNPNICCGYGEKGQSPNGFECIQIPGAVTKSGGPVKNGAVAAIDIEQGNSRFCGRSGGLAKDMDVAATQSSSTICTFREPFQLNFISDSYEFIGENTAGTMTGGFQVEYFQDASMC